MPGMRIIREITHVDLMSQEAKRTTYQRIRLDRITNKSLKTVTAMIRT